MGVGQDDEQHSQALNKLFSVPVDHPNHVCPPVKAQWRWNADVNFGQYPLSKNLHSHSPNGFLD